MDQVKIALSWLKKHHFWVLVVIIVGAVSGVWYTASSSVASETKKNQGVIKGKIDSTNTLFQQPFKPNDGVIKKQQEEAKKLAQNVLVEWDKLYAVQKDQVLIWPEELEPRFIRAVQNANFGDAISTTNREIYNAYIKETFPSIVEIIDAAEVPVSGAGGGRGGGYGGGFGGGEFGGGFGPSGATGPDGQPIEQHLVQWLDQVELRSRMEQDRTPTALQIWVLQEDLWVYDNVLNAIARTNAATGATRQDRAAVQVIYELKVGQAAAISTATETRIAPAEADAAATPSGGGFGDGFGGFGEGGFGGEFGGGYGGEFGGEFGGGYGGGFEGGGYGGGGEFGGGYGGGEYGGGRAAPGAAPGGGLDAGADPETVLLTSRYIDGEGAPMDVTPGDYSYGKEFKRLPVRIVAEVDTKYLPRLIWELANAPLQVEVDEIRFNPQGGMGPNRAAPTITGPGQVNAFERRPNVGRIILQGVVYIFNKPDATIAEFGDQQ